jgi:hypothetical protein
MIDFWILRGMKGPLLPNKKRQGEIGSPWRMPLEGLKLSRHSPLNKVEKEAVVTNLIIISTKSLWKPNRTMIARQ